MWNFDRYSAIIIGMKTRHKSLILIICIILASIFVLVESRSTSPLYKNYWGGDSAQFQTIGAGWADGKVPYVELFDHKGPIMFLINAAGYMLGGRTGLFILQIIAMTVTLLAIIKICRLFSPKISYAFLSIIILLTAISFGYADGNTTQEFCLPLIAWGTYLLLKFLLQEDIGKKPKKHNPKVAGAYGAMVSFIFLIQATNAIPICAGVLAITIYLLKTKQFANLWKNILWFIGGFLIVFLPFAIYFGLQGAFLDFINGTFIYNIKYSASMGSWLKGASGGDVWYFITAYLPAYSVIITGALAFRRKKYTYAIMLLVSFVLEIYWYLSGALFGQYALVSVVQIVLLANELVLLQSKKPDAFFGAVLLASAMFIGLVYFEQVRDYILLTVNSYTEIKTGAEGAPAYDSLMKKIPNLEETSFVAYGHNSLKDIYLRYNINPSSKFFAIQDWHASFSDELKNQIHDSYENSKIDWILAEDSSTDVISDVLSKKYFLVDSTGGYSLYHIK